MYSGKVAGFTRRARLDPGDDPLGNGFAARVFKPAAAPISKPAGRPPAVAVKSGCILGVSRQAPAMTQPLALVFYERLLPGTQLVNRLQDLHYRVHTLADVEALPGTAERDRPMLLLVDLQGTHGDAFAAIACIKASPATAHLPIIAFTSDEPSAGHVSARAAGANLVVQDQALLNHLPQWLEEVLRVE
jgi:CheY-like chemotaxis protein